MAPVLLPRLAGRPVTFLRYPDGVVGQSFFQKDVPAGAPDWIHPASVPHNSSRVREGSIDVDRRAAGAGVGGDLAALELHVPQ
ncbi:hypothetical protein [Kutzneria sp. NPDC051319]|uniref:non-homologous end-joining DNA ligase LigD n=1 Tax=Kutzneria sp. NPDC051319 TaxID=3155047 RepID=UPI003418DC27